MKKWIILIVAIIGATAIFLSTNNAKNSAQTVTSQQSSLSVSETITEFDYLSTDDIPIDDLHRLVNNYRQKNGLHALTLTPVLNESAKAKCDDMIAKDYWSHYPPDTKDAFQEISARTAYIIAGENLAYGHSSAFSVVEGWKYSAPHNKNLLETEFNKVGYAVCYSDNYQDYEYLVIVQHFTD